MTHRKKLAILVSGGPAPGINSVIGAATIRGVDMDPLKRWAGAEALARMHQALDGFIVEGVTTTIPFLGRVLQSEAFESGDVDTKFLERQSHLLEPHA